MKDGGWGEGSNTKFIINTEELEMGGTVSKIDITSTGESTDYQYSTQSTLNIKRMNARTV